LFPEGHLWQRSEIVGVVYLVEDNNACWLHQPWPMHEETT
jgi:hypothetical protein